METFTSKLLHFGIFFSIAIACSTARAQCLCPLDGEGGEFENLHITSCIGTATYPISAEDFMPVSSTIVKTIKLKFIIVQNPNIAFNGNFESSVEIDIFFSDAINDCNNRYSNISTGTFCALPNPNDMRIQFNLSIKDYYSDFTEDYWDNPSSGGYSAWCPGGAAWDLDPLMSSPEEYLNVFFTEDGCNMYELLYGTPCTESPANISCQNFQAL